MGLSCIVPVDVVKQLSPKTNSLEWWQHQHLTDPWTNVIRICIVFIHCRIASNSIARVPIQTIFLISAETFQLLQNIDLLKVTTL